MEITFEKFWSEYPKIRRQAKKTAEQKFKKLIDEEKKQAIEFVIERSKKDEKWRNVFAPMPTTFINQKRWEDEYIPDKQNNKEEKRKDKSVYIGNLHKDYLSDRQLFIRLKPEEKLKERKQFLNFMFVSLTGKGLPEDEEKIKEIKKITYNFFLENPKRMYPDPMLYKHLAHYGTPVFPQLLMQIIAQDKKIAK